tara:strand:- start:5321 stop:5494 length:174 start_codon:yes stop_codon:yes gene_type:complete
MSDIQKGDVVKLKSGGPEMTVTKVGNDMFGVMTVWCSWFNKTDAKEGTFPIEALEKW